jgi:hypothetical protein
MKKALRRNVCLSIGALWFGLAVPLPAETLFDNSTLGSDLHPRFNPGTLQVEDKITLAGTERHLTYFSFDYWGGNTADLHSIPTPDMTWSVQSQGLQATDSVGLDLYSPPVVGADVGDDWQYNGGLMLLTNPTGPMDFGALQQTPEPSSLTLSLLGGLGILIAVGRFRRKE